MARTPVIDRGFWMDRPVLVTGHTGFKGAWLSWWLSALGARVTGLSDRVADAPSLFSMLELENRLSHRLGDVRRTEDVRRAAADSQAEVIFHLAAQSLVRRSYHEPLETWSTNVQGTVSVLEVARDTSVVRAIVVVTSDKCYRNDGAGIPFVETDPLGGHDPYSASKAAAELVAASYDRAFFSSASGRDVGIATARAGNVIGGGDWSADRLLPDAVRAWMSNRPMVIRHPNAVRPWQHVLDPLHGYLRLAERLHAGDQSARTAFNFGPDVDDALPVSAVTDELRAHWGSSFTVTHDESSGPHEALLLRLDASKARRELAWRPVWSSREAIRRTASWHQAVRFDQRTDAVREACDRDLAAFTESLLA